MDAFGVVMFFSGNFFGGRILHVIGRVFVVLGFDAGIGIGIRLRLRLRLVGSRFVFGKFRQRNTGGYRDVGVEQLRF